MPDHSWLNKTRSRLAHEVHADVFVWVLALIADVGLVKGERIGVDSSTMEANAALRNIVRRESGEGYREMLERMAKWFQALAISAINSHASALAIEDFSEAAVVTEPGGAALHHPPTR